MLYNSICKEGTKPHKKGSRNMNTITIRISGTATTFTARNASHAAALINEHSKKTRMTCTYYLYNASGALTGWVHSSK